MAARLTARQSDTTCSAIKTTKLVSKLQTHALAAKDKMTISQVNAARILLNKTLPDQRQTDVKIDGELVIRLIDYGTGDDSE